MRDTSDWYADAAQVLDAANVLPADRLTARDFLSLELGLYFLAEYFPGEPVGGLWPLLSGYVAAPEPLRPVLRRLRHLMGDIARAGYWRHCLDEYRRLPVEIRGFERTDDPLRRVSDSTVFVPRVPNICDDRFDNVFAPALAAPVPYAAEPIRPTAAPGTTYTFTCHDGVEERVRIPQDIPAAVPLPALSPVFQRRRRPWTISFGDDLAPVAVEIDKALQDKPEITNRDFVNRLDKMVFCTVDEDTGALVEKPDSFTIDGVEHFVGLMNSGKSTLADLITKERVDKGFHVTVVLGSVADVYTKVSFLRSLGINAVPLVGKNSRTEHAARYWRSTLAASPTVFPTGDDPAARFVHTLCLLDPLRQGNDPEWQPLSPEDFPCRGALRATDGQRRRHDCPLLAICPYQETERTIADAQVWVTTPAGLVTSRAEPSEVKMRWLEACQHRTDLIIVDEADTVQQHLDDQFLQHETLVAPDEGWTHRTTISKLTGFDRGERRQLLNRRVHRFNEYDRVHQLAVDKLYELVLPDAHAALREVIGSAPFSGFSLLLQVARVMHGLPPRGMTDDAATEDAAEDFFYQRLAVVDEEPFADPPPDMRDLVAALNAEFADPDRVRDALDRWLLTNAPNKRCREHITGQLGLLRLLFQAGYWAGRITTSFFEMSTLYPAVAEEVPLADSDSFWQQQPPRDYQPLVPEAPMGNLLALQWLPNRRGDSGALRVLWVRGVGRWLLHHLHDLLEPEGLDGPHVILTSATSWAPGSSFYHVPIPPTAVLREPPDDRKALSTSSMAFRPARRGDGSAVFVSGQRGPRRHDALREITDGVCMPRPGAARSLLEQIRDELEPGRRQVLFVVLSGAEAVLVTEYINHKTPYHARNVTPDAADPGQYGLHRRLVATFGGLDADILVAAEMAIQRGYNILNANKTAALGAVFYLTRSHPPPTDPKFPLSLINQRAMAYLLDPACDPSSVADIARRLRAKARTDWYGLMSKAVYFRRLDHDERLAFVANALVPMSQTIGRTIRGNQPTRVILCDAAFAPRHADPRDRAPDTVRTSLVVATHTYLADLLTPPPADAPLPKVRDHAIADAVWGLMGHLLHHRDMGH